MIFFVHILKFLRFDHAVARFFRVIARTTAQFQWFANHFAVLPFSQSLSPSSPLFHHIWRNEFLLCKNDSDDETIRNEKQHLKVPKTNLKSKENYDKTHTRKFFHTAQMSGLKRRAREPVYNAHTHSCVLVFCFFYFNSNSFCPVFVTHAVFKWVFKSIVLFAIWACVRLCMNRFSVFVPCFIFQMFDYILFECALYFESNSK